MRTGMFKSHKFVLFFMENNNLVRPENTKSGRMGHISGALALLTKLASNLKEQSLKEITNEKSTSVQGGKSYA